MKRHQILNFNWDYDFDNVLETRHRRIAEHAFAPGYKRRLTAIADKLELLVMHHLQIGIVDDLLTQTEEGVDLVVDYFLGDWWTHDALSRLTAEQKLNYNLNDTTTLTLAIKTNAKALDKSRPSHKLRWYTAFRAGLLMGGLTGRWGDVSKICSWFDATIPPEYSAGEIEDEMFQFLICIAGELNPEPVDGIDQLRMHLTKSRLKRPRLLCAAWEAILAEDQTTFGKAFVDSVEHFVAKPVNSNIAYNVVALPQSIIGLIAEHRGLSLPEMSEKCQAAVVTRESVGFA